jgi:hypothetical protein
MNAKFLSQSFVALTLLAACAKDAPHASKPAESKPPQVSTLPETIERDPLPLAARLTREAEDHPAARQRIAADLAAFAQTGASVLRKRQVLARTLAADYCETAVTGTGLGLALCVFSDATRAAHGLERSHASFDRLIPGRILLLDDSVLLTITKPAAEAARLEAARIGDRFTHGSPAEHAAL